MHKIQIDNDPNERPVAVFTFATEYISGQDPKILHCVIHRSRREALVELRDIRFQLRVESDNTGLFDSEDLVYDAITVLPDRSLRLLQKRTDVAFSDGDQNSVLLADDHILDVVKHKIDRWIESGGSALCDHALNKSK